MERIGVLNIEALGNDKASQKGGQGVAPSTLGEAEMQKLKM